MRIGAAAHQFRFQHVDAKDPSRIGQTSEIADSIDEGDRVRIKVNRKTEIDGYVDSIDVTDDLEQGPMISITGRSLSKDLIDCAAIHATGEWRDAPIMSIAQEICDPFDLTIGLGDGALGPAELATLSARVVAPFRRVSINPGETALEVIKRMAKERGVLVTCNSDGEPVLTIAGARKIIGKLKRGVNIGSGARRRGDERDRFSTYRIFGSSAGDDAWHGENARGGDGVATDEQVKRYRPFVATADGTSSDGDFVRRAEWERNRRAGRARSFVLPVLSWLDPERRTWRPNRLIDVSHPVLRVEGELLIEAVSLAYDINKGDTGTLTLVHPGAYDPFQEPKTRRNRRMWSAWS
jgi:prophage tail gpP-like protein